MKRTLLLSGLYCLMTSLNVQAADGFTIKGEIPGLKAGTAITLAGKERGQHGDIATVKAQSDGSFILTGSVASPSLCELRIESGDSEGNLGKAISLMVENVDMTVQAAHIDSVAPSFYVGTSGLLKEKNVSVKGGRAQDEYKEYTDFMVPYTYAAKDAHYNLYWDEKRDRSEEAKSRMEKTYAEANMNEDAAKRRFIEEHPAYSISGRFWLELLNSPFSFTADELKEISGKVAPMTDSARLAAVNKAITYAGKYLKGSKATDFAVLDTLGTERRLSGFMSPDKYVMIDFWASWCGPCRASIPHVRELYKEYGDRLEILAVSMDNAEKAWRKAMDQEKMEWTQLWANKDLAAPITEAYQISGIPYMLILNPAGEIIYAGHDPHYVSDILANELKK